MAAFAQAAVTEQTSVIHALEASGTIRDIPGGPPVVQAYLPDDQPETVGTLTTTTANGVTAGTSTYKGEVAERSSWGFDWFEAWHVVPRSFDFGNLLSTQSVPIEVFSAHRRLTKEWASFVNNAGAGVTLSGLPTLPTDVGPMNGVPMTLEVSTSGDPFVDSTLDFGFTGFSTIIVPIEIQRIVLWGKRPEASFSMDLEFLTNVLPSKDGTEKRYSPRKNPRQAWEYDHMIEEGQEAQTLENLLFDFQARTFGLPVWYEDAELTAAVTAGDTSITVESTSWRDFRVGGLAVILTSQSTFDVLEIATIGATTLTFASPAINSYPVGTEVFPLSTCLIKGNVDGARWPVNLQSSKMRFTATNNDSDLADLTPFSSYKGKLLMDRGNSIRRGTVAHSYERALEILDNGSGVPFQDSGWPQSRRGHFFAMRAEGRQEIFEMRGMAWALRGRQISWYVPRDSDDLEVQANLIAAGNTMDVANVGYTQFVRNRQPKNEIRVNFVDGSTPLLRTVTGSSSPSPSVDQLIVDVNWPSTITPAEISRVEYVEKVRFDTDRIRIEYDPAGLLAYLVAPVKAVLE